MASIDVLSKRFLSYDKMYSQDLREQSFMDWPFREECNCTPEKVRNLRRCIENPVKSSKHDINAKQPVRSKYVCDEEGFTFLVRTAGGFV